MSVADRLAVVYTGRNQTGHGHGMSLSDSARYHAIDARTMVDMDLHRRISSLKINESDDAPAPVSLALFDSLGNAGNSFYGRYLMATSVADADFEIDDLDDHYDFDDQTWSIILIRRELPQNETKFSMKTLLTIANLDATLDDAVREAEDDDWVRSMNRIGDYELDWVMFPSDIGGLNSSRSYVAIRQRFTVDVRTLFFGTYDISMTIYLYFYIFEGVLVGRVETWDLWVEPGTVRKIVELAADAALGHAVNDLNKELDFIGRNRIFEIHQWKARYLLPGSQAGWESWWNFSTGDGWSVTKGETTDDVTLVLTNA